MRKAQLRRRCERSPCFVSSTHIINCAIFISKKGRYSALCLLRYWLRGPKGISFKNICTVPGIFLLTYIVVSTDDPEFQTKNGFIVDQHNPTTATIPQPPPTLSESGCSKRHSRLSHPLPTSSGVSQATNKDITETFTKFPSL